ncbi:unnamed protein product, partial [Allacma fusca]
MSLSNINCSIACCSECIQTCIWGMAYNGNGTCVVKPRDLGPFILIEIHPGGSCQVPGLDQGVCGHTVVPPTIAPVLTETNWTIVALFIAVIAVSIAFLCLLGLMVYQKL